MDFQTCLRACPCVLMEGALGERLKREYRLIIDGPVAMADLLYRPAGRRALQALWREYRAVAERYGLPFLAATPTRRCNRARVAAAGCEAAIVADNVALLREVQAESQAPMFVGGLMGCRGDAYTGEGRLGEAEAYEFHRWQAGLFAEAGADYLFAGIMPTLPEACGMARAMAETGLPYLISFTIGRDGCLVDGTAIHDAIARIDGQEFAAPALYMANCVHPSIVREALCQPVNRTALVRARFRGIQANTSALSYAELDGAADLKTSPPEELAGEMARLRDEHGFVLFGGCCGTDQRHIEALARRLCAEG